MALSADSLRNKFQTVLDINSVPCVFKYYSETHNSGSYDDVPGLSQSGSNVWVSGLNLPVKGIMGSEEAFLLEQGRILMSDQVLYVLGTVNTSGVWKVGIGSPPSGYFSTVSDGVQNLPFLGSDVYKKMFIRRLQTGSLSGE